MFQVSPVPQEKRMKKRIALSKALFGIPSDQLKLVRGGTGVIVNGERGVNGIGTSPSGSDCALLETRVDALERRLEQRAPAVCERCRNEDPVLRRCRNCERTLCLACLESRDCPNDWERVHRWP